MLAVGTLTTRELAEAISGQSHAIAALLPHARGDGARVTRSGASA
jgi:hypothetical protein